MTAVQLLACNSKPVEPRAVPSAVAPTSPPSSVAAASVTAPPSQHAAPLASFGATEKLADGFVYFNDKHFKDSRSPLEALIVPAAHAARFYGGHGDKPSFWTPRADDVSKLNAALDVIWDKEPSIAQHASDHRYQVVGIVEGRKLLFVNAFCRGKDWKSKPISVDDGGACYFTFKLDPASGVVSALSINGVG